MKCKNPMCKNPALPHRKYCSPSCSYINGRISQGQLSIKDDFGKYRKGVIMLSNGIEVRNDVMGKEIANRMFV